MDVFTMVAVIVVVVILGRTFNTYLENQRANDELADQAGIEAELDELRERVETLEKIVTDPKFQLHRELDALEEESS